jgi:hypothetical protein
LTGDGERLTIRVTVVLKKIIQVNKLQTGMDQIDVKDAWKTLWEWRWLYANGFERKYFYMS